MQRRGFLKVGAAAMMGASMVPRNAPARPWSEMTPEEQKRQAALDERMRRESAALRAKDARPNILFLFTDQQTISAMSCAGNRWVSTPNIDRLAARGVRFTRSYCTSPICTPARGSLVTGRMPHEHGAEYNDRPLRDEIPTMGEVFRAAGYETTWSGKWHLPSSYVDTPDGVRGFTNIPKPQGVKKEGLGDYTDFLYATDAMFHLRCDVSKQPKPWLYGVSLHNPHDICNWVGSYRDAPYPNVAQFPPLPPNFAVDPNEPELVAERRRQSGYGSELRTTADWSTGHWRSYLHAYYHMTEQVDRAVGIVLESLAAGGWLDNTLVVFTSDHGEGVAAHQWVTKLSLYEEAAMVPMILSYPGRIPQGKVDSTHLASGVDVLATMADYAGISLPSMAGRSLRGVIEDPKSAGRPYVVTELAVNPRQPERHGRMVRSARYKYCAYSWGRNPEQLFDLQEDSGETKNRAADSSLAKVLKEHRVMLEEYAKETADSFRRA